ncbi:sugar ABC transporter substrate-binding protein [Actinopolymorpha pittospori]|uniref:ABC transporter substrate-binding protein n=1 Tax=Actinopolymorpha pittospori TaxID=648752 RepID=UPI0031EE7DAD
MIGVLAAALVSACGGQGSGGGSGTVHLVFRQFDPANEVKGLQQVVDGWNKAHPDIQVDMQTLSPANSQQFAREANSGSGPDINLVGYADVAFLAKPKILMPIDDLMKKTPLGSSTDNLLATDMVTFDGKMWALPWTADTFALTYRPDALSRAGVTAPPATWEELASDAKKVDSSSGGKTAGFCFAGAGSATSAQWFAINYYLWSHGATLIKKDASGKFQPGATKQQLASAMDYFNGLFTSGATPASYKAVSDYTDPSITGGLANGGCAMSYEPPQTLRAIVGQAASGAVLTAPMPGGLKDGNTHLGGRALAINANTEHADAAWQFVKYLASPATFKTYNQYPASKSTLESLNVPKPEKGYVEQLPHAQSFARYNGAAMTIASIQQLVDQQFSAVYSGQRSSSDAAQALLDGLSAGLKG